MIWIQCSKYDKGRDKSGSRIVDIVEFCRNGGSPALSVVQCAG